MYRVFPPPLSARERLGSHVRVPKAATRYVPTRRAKRLHRLASALVANFLWDISAVIPMMAILDIRHARFRSVSHTCLEDEPRVGRYAGDVPNQRDCIGIGRNDNGRFPHPSETVFNSSRGVSFHFATDGRTGIAVFCSLEGQYGWRTSRSPTQTDRFPDRGLRQSTLPNRTRTLFRLRLLCRTRAFPARPLRPEYDGKCFTGQSRT